MSAVQTLRRHRRTALAWQITKGSVHLKISAIHLPAAYGTQTRISKSGSAQPCSAPCAGICPCNVGAPSSKPPLVLGKHECRCAGWHCHSGVHLTRETKKRSPCQLPNLRQPRSPLFLFINTAPPTPRRLHFPLPSCTAIAASFP